MLICRYRSVTAVIVDTTVILCTLRAIIAGARVPPQRSPLPWFNGGVNTREDLESCATLE